MTTTEASSTPESAASDLSDARSQATQPGAQEPSSGPSDGRVDVLLVCSAGGHLLQLYALREAWEGVTRAWVTLDRSDARSLLAGERRFFAHGPTNRSLINLIRNTLVAVRVLRELRPRVIISTGAGVAVPFSWIGRFFGARIVYIESLARITAPSLSCRLLRPVAHRIYVQWPELRERLDGARYAGTAI